MNKYEELADASRVWVFQSDREFTENEQQELNAELTNFVNNWLSHGSLLKAYFKIMHNRFIIFIADEDGDRMCGRAVDASVRFVKELEARYSISLLDRNRMAYIDQAGKVHGCMLSELSRLSEEGKIKQETKVFNNLVQNKIEFENAFLVPLSESWQHRFAGAKNISPVQVSGRLPVNS
jgi:hypothetical protein